MTKKNTLFTSIKDAYQHAGLLTTFKKFYYVSSDIFFDLKVNISTTNYRDKTIYANPQLNSKEYSGARYIQIKDTFDQLPVDYRNSTLLDLGSGKGRVIATAATFPFKKIIGVEYDEQLAVLGENNLKKMRFKKAQEIDMQHQNAISYEIPDEVNVIYMYNPFVGETLEKVVDNIRHSYEKSPRTLYILFLNHESFDETIKGQTWLSKVLTMPTVDTVTCCLYVTRSEGGS